MSSKQEKQKMRGARPQQTTRGAGKAAQQQTERGRTTTVHTPGRAATITDLPAPAATSLERCSRCRQDATNNRAHTRKPPARRDGAAPEQLAMTLASGTQRRNTNSVINNVKISIWRTGIYCIRQREVPGLTADETFKSPKTRPLNAQKPRLSA